MRKQIICAILQESTKRKTIEGPDLLIFRVCKKMPKSAKGVRFLPCSFSHLSADCKRGRRKGGTSKTVKSRQKFKCQKVFRHFSTIFARHLFSGPFCNPLNLAQPDFISCALQGLVAQCSATPATVAATPPCSATPFQTQISVRHLPGQGGGKVRHQNF